MKKDDTKTERVHVFGPDNGPQLVLAGERSGVLLPAHEGVPLVPGAEVVSLSKLDRDGPCADMTSLYRVPDAPAAHAGPARYASRAFRDGYDAIKWN